MGRERDIMRGQLSFSHSAAHQHLGELSNVPLCVYCHHEAHCNIALFLQNRKAILHAGSQTNICYMCGGVRDVEQFGSQGGVNLLSVHVRVLGGHHGGVICTQMDCLSVGLL